MANAYAQLYVQLVFGVKGYLPVINEVHRDRIEKYICGIVQNTKCKPISIYCNPNHLHLLIRLHQTMTVADIVREIKSTSTRFINENKLVKGHSEWQRGYGAFSYNQSAIEAVCKYIRNQHEHHKKTTFQEEYLAFLNAFKIEYDKKYVFDE